MDGGHAASIESDTCDLDFALDVAVDSGKKAVDIDRQRRCLYSFLILEDTHFFIDDSPRQGCFASAFVILSTMLATSP